MKKIITILFFTLLCYNCFSQNWLAVQNFGGQVRARAGAFSIGDTGYVIAGGNTWYVPDAWGYDTLTQQWFQIANYPGNDDDPVSCSINGKGYCVTGGTCCPGYGDSLYRYNPFPVNTWTSLAALPGAARTFAVGFVIAGKFYVGGGVNDSATASNSNPLKDFWEYDPRTNSWARIADCPDLGVNEFAFGFAINGEGYVGCGEQITFGNSTGTPKKDFWQYDPGSNTWTQKNDFPGGPIAGVAAYATCDNGYVCCGFSDPNQSVYTNAFWQYDPVNDSWIQLPSYEGVPRMFASAFVIGNTGFVGVGGNPNADLLDFYEFHTDYVPIFTTTGDSSHESICEGQIITFKDSSNFGPTNWYWQFPGGTPDTSTSNNPTVTYNTPGTHDVIFSAWNSCDSASKTFTNYVTVGKAGTLSIQPVGQPVCSGQSITLSVSDTGTYTWTPSTGLNNTTGDSVIATPIVQTVYTVSETGAGGCILTGTDTVKIIPAPALIIEPQDTSLCNGSSVNLIVPASGSDYVWSPAATLSSSTGNSVIATPAKQTTYTVSGIDSLGCAVLAYDTVYISKGINKPIITDTDNVLTTTATQGNQWYRNSSEINGATAIKYTLTDTGCYWDIATNIANGCSSISDTICVTSLAGINRLSINPSQLSIYPNPTGGEIFINISLSVADVNDWNLQITDVLGRTLFTKLSLNYSNDIDLSDLPGGVYFITVINKTARAVVPVVKQ